MKIDGMLAIEMAFRSYLETLSLHSKQRGRLMRSTSFRASRDHGVQSLLAEVYGRTSIVIGEWMSLAVLHGNDRFELAWKRFPCVRTGLAA